MTSGWVPTQCMIRLWFDAFPLLDLTYRVRSNIPFGEIRSPRLIVDSERDVSEGLDDGVFCKPVPIEAETQGFFVRIFFSELDDFILNLIWQTFPAPFAKIEFTGNRLNATAVGL